MASDVKRLNYFKGQFLRENDFIDEQTYHVQHQRDHARMLHTPGIASGLDVPMPPAGSSGVTVQAGVGYDDQGRRIVLANNLPLDLSSFAAGQPVYVTLTYDEQPSDPTSETGITGSTRFTEKPIIQGSLTAPANPKADLVLARVIRTGTNVTSIDVTGRLNAGVKGGDLLVNSLTVSSSTVDPTQWPSVRTTGPAQLSLTGNLQISGTLSAGSLAANLVGTTQIANLAVTTAKLADASVTTAKVVDGNITTAKILDAAVTTAKLADASVTTAKVVDASITTAKILDAAVTNTKLVDNAVTTTKIADSSVTAAKILDGTVGTAELANLAVTAAKIADLNVTSTKLADLSVTSAKLADASVTTNKLADASVMSAKLADASVTANKLGDGSVKVAKVADRAIPFRKLDASAYFDVPSSTINASGTIGYGVSFGASTTGGLWFVDAWAVSSNAFFNWIIGGYMSPTLGVVTRVAFTNLTAATITIGFKIYYFNPG